MANERYGLYLLSQSDKDDDTCTENGNPEPSKINAVPSVDESTEDGKRRRIIEGGTISYNDDEDDDSKKKNHNHTKGEAMFRLRELVKWYREWGAYGKVKTMEEQHNMANLIS